MTQAYMVACSSWLWIILMSQLSDLVRNLNVFVCVCVCVCVCVSFCDSVSAIIGFWCWYGYKILWYNILVKDYN